PNPVRLETMRAPDALDGTCADAGCFRHQGSGPVGRLDGRLGLGEHHDTFSNIRSKGRDTRGARLVTQQAAVTFLHEAFLPAPDTGLRFAGLTHDLVGTDAVRAQQHDLGTPDMLMRRFALSLASAARRRRSADLRVMDIPVRMGQTRTGRARRESHPGYKCQN